MRRPKDILYGAALTAALVAGSGCSPRHLAEEALANSLAGSSDTFSTDDDPKLVAAAIPFGLKTMEALLQDLPTHVPLLTAAASGFAGFAYAFVQQDADEASDRAAALPLKTRARKLLLRARDYGVRGLDAAHVGLGGALVSGNAEARARELSKTTVADVPLLYWTAAAWGMAISDGKDDMKLVGQLPVVKDLAGRAYALAPTWNEGALEDFYISFEMSPLGGGADKAKAHYQKALEESRGTRLGVLVSYAESVLTTAQDRAGFNRLLNQVLAYDVDKPEARANRLANLLAQRRARWLLSKADELFL